jgi:4-amino-4-deoxy-L-arabinose transferase-like glycosyltransferase
MAMGRHLDLFKMEFPPFIAIVSELERGVFGDALWSVRLLPAIAHGALVIVTALIAQRLGGNRAAQLIAVVAVATAPLFLRAGSLFQPVIFDQLWWTVALYVLVVIASEPELATSSKLWIWLGAAAGLGLLTKFTIFALGLGVLAGLVAVRRDLLRTRGPWLAFLIAVIVGSPSWIGQLRLGMPVLGQMGDLRETQLERISYDEFMIETVLMHGPAAFLLAMCGLITLLASKRFTRYRIVGWACLAPALAIMLMRGKPYYIGPVFPLLFAAGAAWLVIATERVQSFAARRVIYAFQILLLAAWGLYALPLALPISPPEKTAAFAAKLGITSAVKTNRGDLLPLPQDYADMLGWKEKVAHVARVYHALPPADQREAVIIATNYGQAGAIDFYGDRYSLPDAEAPVGSYWFWGPGPKPGNVIIKVGEEAEALRPFCGEVELGARITDDRWLVPEEQNLAIWICRRPHRTLQEVWPMFRGQN